MVDEALRARECEEVKGVDEQPPLPGDRQGQVTPLPTPNREAAGQGVPGCQWQEKMGGDEALER